MRVVVDTNVFVSSFFGGIHRKIADLWKKGRIILCLSKPIVEEYVIECAVALNATYVVSGDKSLLGVGEYMGISIVTPRHFMDAINE